MKNKKEKLLEAGMFYFSINGIDTTRVEDITKKAGVAKGTFYTYFKSKEDLLEQIMVERLKKYVELFENLKFTEASFEEKMMMYLRKRFVSFIEDPKMFFMILALRKSGEIMLLEFLKGILGRRGDKLIRDFFEANREKIKEEYRGELDIITPSIMTSLFSYQEIIIENLGIKIEKEEDYEKISIALREINIEKYIQQFYNLNIKEMIREE